MSGSRDSAAFIAIVQATAGAAGGVLAALLLQPLEVAKTRIQISHSGDDSTFQMCCVVVREEGVLGLFRGVSTKCSETGSKNFVYFYIYDAINAMAKQQTKLTTGVKLLLGYIAGVGTTVATMPLEVLATMVQAETTDEGTLALAQKVVQREGIRGLFKGFWYNILLCINPSIQNTVFDRMKDSVVKYKKGHLTPFDAFVLGAVAKAIATLVTYPLVRLKTILQAGADLEAPAIKESTSGEFAAKGAGAGPPGIGQRSGSTGSLLQQMSFRQDRPSAMQSVVQRVVELYRGLGSALTKSVIQAAVLYMTKDQVALLVRRLFKVSAKAFFRKDGTLKLGVNSGRPIAS